MSSIYPKWKKSLMIGDDNANLLNGDVRIIMLSSAYAFDAAHQFLPDIPMGVRIAVSELLTGKTISDAAAFGSDNPTTLAVPGGTDVATIAMFIDTGVEATCRLVFFEDSELVGVPFTPVGSDVVLTVNAAGWFTL